MNGSQKILSVAESTVPIRRVSRKVDQPTEYAFEDQDDKKQDQKSKIDDNEPIEEIQNNDLTTQLDPEPQQEVEETKIEENLIVVDKSQKSVDIMETIISNPTEVWENLEEYNRVAKSVYLMLINQAIVIVFLTVMLVLDKKSRNFLDWIASKGIFVLVVPIKLAFVLSFLTIIRLKESIVNKIVFVLILIFTIALELCILSLTQPVYFLHNLLSLMSLHFGLLSISLGFTIIRGNYWIVTSSIIFCFFMTGLILRVSTSKKTGETLQILHIIIPGFVGFGYLLAEIWSLIYWRDHKDGEDPVVVFGDMCLDFAYRLPKELMENL